MFIVSFKIISHSFHGHFRFQKIVPFNFFIEYKCECMCVRVYIYITIVGRENKYSCPIIPGQVWMLMDRNCIGTATSRPRLGVFAWIKLESH